jgi:hypothetical protein
MIAALRSKEVGLRSIPEKELKLEQLEGVAAGGLLSNIANMRHEMLKAVANNLRA